MYEAVMKFHECGAGNTCTTFCLEKMDEKYFVR